MKRSSRQYALLLALLDEALELPRDARNRWLDALPESQHELRPALARLLEQSAESGSSSALDAPARVAAMMRQASAVIRSEAEIGMHVGPYVLMRELGRGGMSSVWLAERADGAFRRLVALKLPFVTWGRGLKERVQQERDILAALEHPNIARFYDAGVDEHGRPFMALELVDGGLPIDVYCANNGLNVRDRLRLILEVTGAVAHAHAKLVVHRDLKPGNILVTPDGHVRLLDFGIAKLLNAAPGSVTRWVGRPLTPDYASPEQVRGDTIDTGTDVYSLGVITYELLAGKKPYRLKRDSQAALEQAILEVEPLAASESALEPAVSRQLRGDIDAILNKAMKKDRAERYVSIAAFAEDIERYCSNRPVRARPDRVGYLLKKYVARHTLPVVAVLLVTVAVFGGTAVALWQAHNARAQAQRATATKDFLVSLFRGNDPRVVAIDKPRDQLTARDLLDQASTRIEKEFAGSPEIEIELLGLTADIYDYLSDEKHYVALQERRIDVARKFYGPTHPIVIEGLLNQIDAACTRVDYENAIRLVTQVDQLLTSIGDDSSLLRAKWWGMKARALRNVPGKKPEYEAALSEALRRYGKLAPRSNEYAVTLNLAARDYADSDDYEASAKTQSLALSVASSAEKRDEALLTTLQYNLARTQERLGRFEAAQDLYRRAEEAGKKSYGEHDSVYWLTLANHARLVHMLGHRDEAHALFAAMLQAVPVDWKTDRNDVRVRDIYAQSLAAEGRPLEALPILEEVRKAYIVKATHVYDVREASNRLGDVYDQLGRTDEARPLLDTAWRECVAQEGVASRSALRLRERWARFLVEHARSDNGDFNAARTELLAVLAGVGNRPMVEAALAHAGLARLAAAANVPQAALDESLQSLSALDKAEGLFDVRLRPRLWLEHSYILLLNGDESGAKTFALKALSASQAYDDPRSAAIAAARDAAERAQPHAEHPGHKDFVTATYTFHMNDISSFPLVLAHRNDTPIVERGPVFNSGLPGPG